ncbi:MAG: hypothetical protein K2O42_01320 [Oscillospiraceae bacterium]|nr:hypothetical protein [Oscillospiraceae bacterium]
MRNSQKIAVGILAATVVFAGSAKSTPMPRIEDAFLNLTAAAADDALSISNGTNVPDTIAKGKGLAVKGVVSSETSDISSVTVGIYDSSRKLVTGKSALPKAKSYNIAKLDSYIEFDKLPAGTYTYMVFATNETSTNYVLTNKSFTVTDGSTPQTPAASDTMSISNGTSLPAALKKGKCVTVKGVVTSSDSNITSLTVGVYDKDGKLMTGKTVAPNAKTYNVTKVDSDIAFNKLDNGTYTYKVIATNAANTDFVVVSQEFAVTADGNAPVQDPVSNQNPGATTDTMSIAGSTEVPDKLAKGKTVIVKGTVTSAESNIESLTVGIYDTQGKLVTGKTAIPNAKTYDLNKLDNYIEFNKLPDGTYAYMVFASNGVSKNYVMVNKAFTVGEGSGQVASDVMAIANGTTVPSTIAKGKGVSVKGTVASASSEITSLTVGVYDSNNTMATGKTVAPNAKTYNLNKLDNDILFNQLAEGDYTYKVFASNASTKDYALVEQKFTVGNKTAASDLLTIANGTSVPESLKKGSCLNVKGTVSSATSDIKSVTVGIYDSQNKLVTGKTAIPNAKTYNLNKLDSYVEFNKLTDGVYSYMVFATNAANTNYVITNQKFTVGNATSSNSGTTSSNEKGISFTGGTSIPETISKGRGVAVRGTINSDSTIKAVTVAIYDANNQLVTSKSVAPDASSYDLKNIDKYIEFDKLPAGSYTYRVAVTTTATKDHTADRQTFNVK